MKLASFALEQVFFPETTVKANVNYVSGHADDQPSEPRVKIYLNRNDDKTINIIVRYEQKAISPADPYEIEVVALGRFSSTIANMTEENTQLMRSAPNILYGSIREHVLSITSRSAWAEHALPAVTFERSDFQFLDDDQTEEPKLI
jgi:preprotein translocase subunit SecB